MATATMSFSQSQKPEIPRVNHQLAHQITLHNPSLSLSLSLCSDQQKPNNFSLSALLCWRWTKEEIPKIDIPIPLPPNGTGKRSLHTPGALRSFPIPPLLFHQGQLRSLQSPHFLLSQGLLVLGHGYPVPVPVPLSPRSARSFTDFSFPFF